MSVTSKNLDVQTSLKDRKKVWDFGKARSSGGGGDGGGNWVRAKKTMSPEALEQYKALSEQAAAKLKHESQTSSSEQASAALNSSLL